MYHNQDTQEQDAMKSLLEMGFSETEVLHAIESCGKGSSIFVLSDFIQAHYGDDHAVGTVDQFCNKQPVAAVQCSSNDTQEQDATATLLEMGFSETHVLHAIEACGKGSSVFVLSDFIQAHYRNDHESGNAHQVLEEKSVDAAQCSSNKEEILKAQTSPMHVLKDAKKTLLEMGFSPGHVLTAIKACGKDSPVFVLSDFIQAHYGNDVDDSTTLDMQDEGIDEMRMFGLDSGPSLFPSVHIAADGTEGSTLKNLWEEFDILNEEKQVFFSSSESEGCIMVSSPRKEKLKLKGPNSRKKRSRVKEDKYMLSSKIDFGSMTGFGVPGHLPLLAPRKLNPPMSGPPYFYFENVITLPSSWDTIRRHFHGVDPEFVDSKYFSASKRERGYVHNLPIEGRELIIRPPPMTIKEAFPETKEHWPSWDKRTKLECIAKRRASDLTCSKVRGMIAQYEGTDIPLQEQQGILSMCKEWNLVWVGPGQVAPLEPHEIEMLLGLDHDHTRGSFTMTERLEALGNSFQINTVAYHLSPLRGIYPHGVNVLSLFAGIGGAEMALHKDGIFLKCVVCVEIKEKCRNVVESWWKKTNQEGRLILMADVQSLTSDVLSEIVEQVGGFDLIIGGSPCSDPSGVTALGLHEEDCCLFYEFPRVLNIVKQLMYACKTR